MTQPYIPTRRDTFLLAVVQGLLASETEDHGHLFASYQGPTAEQNFTDFATKLTDTLLDANP